MNSNSKPDPPGKRMHEDIQYSNNNLDTKDCIESDPPGRWWDAGIEITNEVVKASVDLQKQNQDCQQCHVVLDSGTTLYNKKQNYKRKVEESDGTTINSLDSDPNMNNSLRDIVFYFVSCNHLLSYHTQEGNLSNYNRYVQWARDYFGTKLFVKPKNFKKLCLEYYSLEDDVKDQYFWKCSRCKEHNPSVFGICGNGCRPSRSESRITHRRTQNFKELERALKSIVSTDDRKEDRRCIDSMRCQQTAKQLFDIDEHTKNENKQGRKRIRLNGKRRRNMKSSRKFITETKNKDLWSQWTHISSTDDDETFLVTFLPHCIESLFPSSFRRDFVIDRCQGMIDVVIASQKPNSGGSQIAFRRRNDVVLHGLTNRCGLDTLQRKVNVPCLVLSNDSDWYLNKEKEFMYYPKVINTSSACDSFGRSILDVASGLAFAIINEHLPKLFEAANRQPQRKTLSINLGFSATNAQAYNKSSIFSIADCGLLKHPSIDANVLKAVSPLWLYLSREVVQNTTSYSDYFHPDDKIRNTWFMSKLWDYLGLSETQRIGPIASNMQLNIGCPTKFGVDLHYDEQDDTSDKLDGHVSLSMRIPLSKFSKNTNKFLFDDATYLQRGGSLDAVFILYNKGQISSQAEKIVDEMRNPLQDPGAVDVQDVLAAGDDKSCDLVFLYSGNDQFWREVQKFFHSGHRERVGTDASPLSGATYNKYENYGGCIGGKGEGVSKELFYMSSQDIVLRFLYKFRSHFTSLRHLLGFILILGASNGQQLPRVIISKWVISNRFTDREFQSSELCQFDIMDLYKQEYDYLRKDDPELDGKKKGACQSISSGGRYTQSKLLWLCS